MRANSLTNLGVSLDYNVASDYDKVLVLSGIASEIEELAPHANEIATIVANLPDVLTVQEASELVNNLTVKVTTLPEGSTATSELVGTEIRLGIPAGTQGAQGIQGPKGDKGNKGDIGLTGANGPAGATGLQGLRGFRGEDGLDGEGVVITSILNNINKSLTINFSDGTQHTTDPLKGEDGRSVTITNVVNKANGTMLINFSDGTSHHTADLRGVQGPKGDKGNIGDVGLQGIQGLKGDTGPRGLQGIQGLQGLQGNKGDKGNIGPEGQKGLTGDTGPKGDTGVSVHHSRATSTTNHEGNFSVAGEIDTYTMYGDTAETIVLGEFNVSNGSDAYIYAVASGYVGTSTEFYSELATVRLYSEQAQLNANAAAASEASALTYKNSAGTSATTATTKASAASASAAAALVSETNANTSKNTAATSATTATTKASEAYMSASNASTSATNASTSASAASVSASTSVTKATEAATSASTALGYKNDVSTMKLAIETIYDTFDDRFLGTKTTNPLVDNDGNALLDGALYFNTTTNAMKVYDVGTTTWYSMPQIYLNSLLDVELTSLTTGNILVWNGTKWINYTLSKADVGLNLVDNTADSAKNVLSATKLKTARTINGVSFDGSANITIVDSTKAPLNNPVFTGGITEKVYNLTGTAISPANGTIQYKTVSSNTTFTETLAAGQSVILRLVNANSYTITFPTITWVGAGAPTLTANCAIVLWKEQSTLYGAYVGTLV